MKKYAVIGAGLMGRVAAKTLAESEPDASVTLIDNNESLLKEVSDYIGRKNLEVCKLDVNDTEAAAALLRGHCAAVSALPHRFSLPALEAAILARVSIVDLVGEGPEKRLALHKRAEDADIVIIPGCGVAPGISNVCVGRGVELLDETEEAVIYVGGLPRMKKPPLYYQTLFSLESVFNAYLRPARIIKDGKTAEVEPLSGLEIIDFPEPVGSLEAFFADGLASLCITMKDKISGFLAEKTLRYPGHADRIAFLKSCNLLDKEPAIINSNTIKPFDFLVNRLSEIMKLSDEGDFLVMRVIVKGMKNGKQQTHTFELIDHYDPATHYTAMARTTAFPAVIAARMITDGTINTKGVQFPEQVFSASRFHSFASALEKYNIRINHIVQ